MKARSLPLATVLLFIFLMPGCARQTPYISDFEHGYDAGYNVGYDDGHKSGIEDGYGDGYSKGYSDAEAEFSSYYDGGYADGYYAGRSIAEISEEKESDFLLVWEELDANTKQTIDDAYAKVFDGQLSPYIGREIKSKADYDLHMEKYAESKKEMNSAKGRDLGE